MLFKTEEAMLFELKKMNDKQKNLLRLIKNEVIREHMSFSETKKALILVESILYSDALNHKETTLKAFL